MATKVKRDPDNKWYVKVEWGNWLGPDENLLSVSFILDAALTEISTSVNGTDAYLVATGGTVDTDYPCVCRITYSNSTLSLSDLTEDRTFTIQVREK